MGRWIRQGQTAWATTGAAVPPSMPAYAEPGDQGGAVLAWGFAEGASPERCVCGVVMRRRTPSARVSPRRGALAAHERADLQKRAGRVTTCFTPGRRFLSSGILPSGKSTATRTPPPPLQRRALIRRSLVAGHLAVTLPYLLRRLHRHGAAAVRRQVEVAAHRHLRTRQWWTDASADVSCACRGLRVVGVSWCASVASWAAKTVGSRLATQPAKTRSAPARALPRPPRDGARTARGRFREGRQAAAAARQVDEPEAAALARLLRTHGKGRRRGRRAAAGGGNGAGRGGTGSERECGVWRVRVSRTVRVAGRVSERSRRLTSSFHDSLRNSGGGGALTAAT